MSVRASWGLTAGPSTRAFGRAGSTTKPLSRCARTSAIIPLRPRIPLAPGAVPASDSALRMLLPPPGRSSRLSAAPAGESWLRRLSMGRWWRGCRSRAQRTGGPALRRSDPGSPTVGDARPGRPSVPAPVRPTVPQTATPIGQSSTSPLRIAYRTILVPRTAQIEELKPGCTASETDRATTGGDGALKSGGASRRTSRTRQKWLRAIAKETEPRYPSLRCLLRYWLAMPPPAYPVAVPMPAAPVAHTAAVAMVPMLDE